MSMTMVAKSGLQLSPARPTTPEVFTILNGKTGCEWVRLIHPFRYLVRHGISARILPESELPSLQVTGLPPYNIFILARRIPKEHNVEQMLALIAAEQRRGVKVVYEIDDDPFSPRFHSHPEEIKTILRAVDAAIVSTVPLGKRLAPYTRVKPYVVPNYIDGELWDLFPRKFPTSEITIGISGSTTHYEDWKLVAEPLHRIAALHPQVNFVTYGYTPDYLADLPRLHQEEARHYRYFPGPLKQFDIGLAPLIYDDEGFNVCKSPIKALDYMVAGAAALCSDHTVYRQVEGVRRVKDDQWFDVLDFYIRNPHELERLKRRGEMWARKNRLLATGWREFAQALRRIVCQVH